jgi:papain like cysteine protease AvrRpt2
MSLPKLLQETKQKIKFPAIAAMGGAPQSSATLPFSQQRQQQDQWCWAAVTVSVSLFYDAGTGWTQCSLVNAELSRVDCCSNGSSSACNKPSTLDAPLSRTGNLRGMNQTLAPFPDVVSEIGSKHPLGCRIGWALGGGHFVVVRGYSIGANGSWVNVADPFYGPSTYVYSVFCTSYRNSGKWTHSYFTQP